MPTRRKGGDLILFSSEDPQPLVGWLIDTFGLQAVLQVLSNHAPGEVRSAPAKSASKKGGKKRGRPRGSKTGGKKGGRKSRKATGPGGAGETGNG